MSDESDYAVRKQLEGIPTMPPTPKIQNTTTPPAAKVSWVIGRFMLLGLIIVASTVLVVVDKLPVMGWGMLMSYVVGQIAGSSKPEGAIGEQTLERLMKR